MRVPVPAGIRRSRFDLARADRVLEVVGIEAIASALRGLGLRIHEEPELSALRGVRERHVVSGVERDPVALDRKSTRLNSSHGYISYAVFCLKKKKRSKSRSDLRVDIR